MVSKNIILISDPKVLEIPIQENNDPLVDIRDFTEILVDARESEVSNSYFMLRKSVVDLLLSATKYLPRDICFLIVEGHRSLSLQKRYFKEYLKKLKIIYPSWNKEQIYKEVSKFVAPPKFTPPHSTGGAIDLTLATSIDNELDMGTSLSASPEESDNGCFTSAENISDLAKENRRLLVDAMSKVGFVNYPTEWWHWSYGDRYWAHQVGNPFALFNSIKPKRKILKKIR